METETEIIKTIIANDIRIDWEALYTSGKIESIRQNVTGTLNVDDFTPEEIYAMMNVYGN